MKFIEQIKAEKDNLYVGLQIGVMFLAFISGAIVFLSIKELHDYKLLVGFIVFVLSLMISVSMIVYYVIDLFARNIDEAFRIYADKNEIEIFLMKMFDKKTIAKYSLLIPGIILGLIMFFLFL